MLYSKKLCVRRGALTRFLRSYRAHASLSATALPCRGDPDTFCQCLCKTVTLSLPYRGCLCLRFPRCYRGHTPAKRKKVCRYCQGKNNQVRFVASRCRMCKRFSEDAGSVVDPETKTPRRVKLVEGFSPGRPSIRMQGDVLHLEWIRDSSTPRAYRATQDSGCSSS
jgi:hypothetical protein